MKEITKTYRHYELVQVEKGTVNKTIYVSDDGKKESERKAEIAFYEGENRYKSLERRNIDVPFSDLYNWFRLKNEDEVQFFKTYNGFLDYKDNRYDSVDIDGEDVLPWELKLPVNEWFGYQYNDGGDYAGSYHFYTLSYVKEQLNLFLKEFE